MEQNDDDEKYSYDQIMIDTISNVSSGSGISKESVARKLEKIELKIKSKNISKKERRLL